MTIATLIKYLCGNRRAVLDVAANPQSVWLGLLFVLSAGFAREYDGTALLHEVWHLLLPLGASLVTSILLFALVFSVARLRGCKSRTFLSLYRQFLGLYWMTAPLAWLYAIPVERFLSPGEATQFNLSLLALVSLWRVGLMTRVISVLFQASLSASFFIVMFFADSLALVILYMTPLPVFNIMGGIRLSPTEQAIQDAAFLVGLLGTVSWLIWLCGIGMVASRKQPVWTLAIDDYRPVGPVQRSLWGLAACSLVLWILVLPGTQREQELKWQVEYDLRAGRLNEAIATMSAHEQAEFPPHWDPPPRIGYGENHPPIVELMRAVIATETKPWVHAMIVDKLRRQSRSFFPAGLGEGILEYSPDGALNEYLEILEVLPEGFEIVRTHKAIIDEVLNGKKRSESVLKRLQALRDAAEAGSLEVEESSPAEQMEGT